MLVVWMLAVHDQEKSGFEISAESETTWPTRLRLGGRRDDTVTRVTLGFVF